MNSANAEKIGATLGTFLQLDDHNLTCLFKRFIRIKVLLDSFQRLKTGCYMNREDGTKLWLAFRYERLSDFCYKCGLITHTESACSMAGED